MNIYLITKTYSKSYRLDLKEDVDLRSFVTTDPTDCTLVLVGGRFLERFPEVLNKLDGKGFRAENDSSGPDAAIRRFVKI